MTMQPHMRRQAAAKILRSDLSALQKVRQLVALGYDEADADSLVSSSQVSQNNLLYYEQLPNPDYETEAQE